MQNRIGYRKLGRRTAHRIAMLRNQADSLIRYGAITTTLPKCKELRRFVEPLITRAKTDNLANRRRANRDLPDRGVVHYLFEELGPRYQNRPGGYTRITRLPDRASDSAPMGKIELVND